MNNYLVIGIILVLGMIQLISINLQLRQDVKSLKEHRDINFKRIHKLEGEYKELDEIHNRVCERYDNLKLNMRNR